ncbi:MAG: type II toxin-antitoxin system PemK/MazF family toxin [Rhodospirillaceae bacterium]|nr:type II toxin-antitoxin system PemK/MazF family toxin [Rhodospirillaceae bacterium]
MNRGDIHYARLDPVVGSEMGKSRPVVIVSNDTNNKHNDTVTVMPLSTNLRRVYPFEVLVKAAHTGLKKDSKVLAQQIRTISKLRISPDCIGGIYDERLKAVEAAMRLHLDLD